MWFNRARPYPRAVDDSIDVRILASLTSSVLDTWLNVHRECWHHRHAAAAIPFCVSASCVHDWTKELRPARLAIGVRRAQASTVTPHDVQGFVIFWQMQSASLPPSASELARQFLEIKHGSPPDLTDTLALLAGFTNSYTRALP